MFGTRLTLALNEDALVLAVPADRALEPGIVGARSSPIPMSADVTNDRSVESKRLVRARIFKELAQRASAACAVGAGRRRTVKGSEPAGRHQHTDQTLTSRKSRSTLALRYSLRRMQGRAMERKRVDTEPEAETPLPHVPRATSMPASTGPTAQGEETSDPSPRRDREGSAWTGADLAMRLPARMRDVLKRYGLAFALASLALLIRAALPVPEGTTIYQLPIVAVLLSAWYGGRGPGLFASLICAVTILYRFIPPANSFELTSDYALAFFIFIALCLLLSEFSSGRRRAEHALRAAEHELRRAHEELEARHANLLDVTHDAIFARDMNDVITYWNRGAQELMDGLRRKRSARTPRSFCERYFRVPSSRSAQSFCAPGDGRANSRRRGRTARRSSSRAAGRCSAMRTADRLRSWIRTTTSPSASAARTRSASSTRSSSGEAASLKRATRSSEAFAYSASHDLRAPLRHVAAYAELLQKTAAAALDERSRRYVTNLLEAGKEDGRADRRPAGVLAHRSGRDAHDAGEPRRGRYARCYAR